MAVLVVLLVLVLTKPGFSQTNDGDNVMTGMYCGRNALISLPDFVNNRNSTFNELRIQLLSKGVLYARAQALSAGESVYSAVQCRNYLSVDQCVACIDAGVSKLANCISGNGGFISFDNCAIRYEDYADFYNDPYVMEDVNRTPNVLCGNQSTSQPTVFKQVVDGFLSDIRDATPKTSNLYVASTRQITGENATVYVTAQCAEGNSSNVAIIAAAVAGVVLILFVLLSWLLYRSWKKSKMTEQDFEGAVHYNYKDLQLATNNFSEENILGKGGFGEVFKAVLDDANVVAVKKLQIQHGGAKEEFENEIKLISNIHHRNLLRLLGWSVDGSSLLLVLEYMPNGSLDRFLWGKLKWPD
ncbi:hypothetical protein L1987_37005 [Smallanthus sonchifolius]|uniref:Uncharacterized protein n=1 Tax=Smallanthus sonchifolius TaxID=185202 RepID=A0ACB9HF51_9ASTR|nr:hypothetical protein L1987_37005 [Smallanthus sonchifolius]